LPQAAAAPQAAGTDANQNGEEIQKGPSVTKSGDGGFRLEISFIPPSNAELAEDPDALGTTKMKWVPTGGTNHITENNTLGTGVVYVLEYRTDPTDPEAWEPVPNAASWYANEAGLAAGNTVVAGERGATIAVFETLDHDTYGTELGDDEETTVHQVGISVGGQDLWFNVIQDETTPTTAGASTQGVSTKWVAANAGVPAHWEIEIDFSAVPGDIEFATSEITYLGVRILDDTGVVPTVAVAISPATQVSADANINRAIITIPDGNGVALVSGMTLMYSLDDGDDTVTYHTVVLEEEDISYDKYTGTIGLHFGLFSEIWLQILERCRDWR